MTTVICLAASILCCALSLLLAIGSASISAENPPTKDSSSYDFSRTMRAVMMGMMRVGFCCLAIYITYVGEALGASELLIYPISMIVAACLVLNLPLENHFFKKISARNKEATNTGDKI